jgi:hypothetical protein
MRRLLAILLLLLGAAGASAQQTIVSATVIDPNGHPWQAATGHANAQCTGNAQAYYNGSPLPRSITIPALSGTGFFQITLWSTNVVTDTNNQPLTCQWQMQFIDHCQVATFSVLVTGVTGPGPVDLTSQINAAAVPLSPACTPGAGTGGTVTSVALSATVPTDALTAVVSGSPVTISGTLALTLSKAIVNANLFAAGPTSGSGQWAFRAITLADLPDGYGSTPCPISQGCTGTTQNPIKRIILPYASCNNTTPAPAWDLPASNAAVPTCKTGGTNATVQGGLAFAQSQLAYYSGIVPSDWQSWNVARITFTTSDTTAGHQTLFTVSLACEAPNQNLTDDPAYGSLNNIGVTIGAGAVANASQQGATASSLMGGNCAASSVLHVKLARASDTNTDTAVFATGWLEILYSGTYQ